MITRNVYLIITILLFIYIKIIVSLSPIIVRGNKMYTSDTGERFIIKGLTYEYAISDDYYQKYGIGVFNTNLKNLQGHYNTIRLYNINPDKSYKLFMTQMNKLGVYVFVSATPDNNAYFGDYRYATMRKDVGPNDRVSCYPAKLLQYAKNIAKNFAQYDNTLGIIMGNEIMQINLIPAACVKQYVADLKNWMRINAKKMRILPLAYAAADSAYTGYSTVCDADNYGPLKILGLLCGDVMKNGRMLQSIDIYLLNTYRWCGQSTYAAGFSRMVQWADGLPIVIALGEYGCRQPGDPPRSWEMITYLVGDNTDGYKMTDVYSGGIAYSYGQANLGADSLFPMFTNGSYELDGPPSSSKTADYDNFVEQCTDHNVPLSYASWNSAQKCLWTPSIATTYAESNTYVAKFKTWITDDCSAITPGNGDNVTWITSTRQGAPCDSSGNPCEVDVTSVLGTTEEDLCGTVIDTSGGGKCKTDLDCGANGVCNKGSDGILACQCHKYYTGTYCDVVDTEAKAVITSSKTAPIYIVVGTCAFIAILSVVFGIYFVRAKSHNMKNTKLESQISDNSTGGEIHQTASI